MKGKGNSQVMFLHHHKPACLACQTVDWSLTTQIKQWESNVVVGRAGICGEGHNMSSRKNACMGG